MLIQNRILKHKFSFTKHEKAFVFYKQLHDEGFNILIAKGRVKFFHDEKIVHTVSKKGELYVQDIICEDSNTCFLLGENNCVMRNPAVSDAYPTSYLFHLLLGHTFKYRIKRFVRSRTLHFQWED
jgi:hypothetical protein